MYTHTYIYIYIYHGEKPCSPVDLPISRIEQRGPHRNPSSPGWKFRETAAYRPTAGRSMLGNDSKVGELSPSGNDH